MVLKNTNQLLSNGGEALFAAVYDSPYFNIYDKISKKEKWRKYMHDVENLLPKFASWPNVTDTYAKKVELSKKLCCEQSSKCCIYSPYMATSHNLSTYLGKKKESYSPVARYKTINITQYFYHIFYVKNEY